MFQSKLQWIVRRKLIVKKPEALDNKFQSKLQWIVRRKKFKPRFGFRFQKCFNPNYSGQSEESDIELPCGKCPPWFQSKLQWIVRRKFEVALDFKPFLLFQSKLQWIVRRKDDLHRITILIKIRFNPNYSGQSEESGPYLEDSMNLVSVSIQIIVDSPKKV